jgi:CRP-like cAMP-binding protein
MTAADTFAALGRNRLLAALPSEDLERLRPQLTPVQLAVRDVLYEPNKPIAAVYFPTSGVTSIVATMDDGAAVEVATIGNEGMVGLPVFLGAESAPTTAFCQVAGTALRLDANGLRDLLGEEGSHSTALMRVLSRYTQALMNQIGQTAACNRHHPIEQRCARWLLMIHDRVGADTFPLTQQFLAQMLGVRRASVNQVARTLQAAGLVTYRRGVIRIVDRARLETAACACYEIIRAEFDRLFPSP